MKELQLFLEMNSFGKFLICYNILSSPGRNSLAIIEVIENDKFKQVSQTISFFAIVDKKV